MLSLLLLVLGAGVQRGAEPPADADEQRKEVLRGRVVFMAEALQRRFGVKSKPHTAQYLLALETRDGQLVPLVDDVRGGSFRKDKRLRELDDVELLVRRHPGSPMAQVIRIYAHRKDGRHELDYWCEICSIAMFELKACDCCQGDIELRFRRAAE